MEYLAARGGDLGLALVSTALCRKECGTMRVNDGKPLEIILGEGTDANKGIVGFNSDFEDSLPDEVMSKPRPTGDPDDLMVMGDRWQEGAAIVAHEVAHHILNTTDPYNVIVVENVVRASMLARRRLRYGRGSDDLKTNGGNGEEQHFLGTILIPAKQWEATLKSQKDSVEQFLKDWRKCINS